MTLQNSSDYKLLHELYISKIHEYGLILYIVLAPMSILSFLFYIHCLLLTKTIDGTVRNLSIKMSLCCIVCTINQIGVYLFQVLLYNGLFPHFPGFTHQLCLIIWAPWMFCGQMVLLLALLISIEIVLIARRQGPAKSQFTLVIRKFIAWLFATLTVNAGIYQADAQDITPMCSPVQKSDPAVRFAVFGLFVLVEITSAVLLNIGLRTSKSHVRRSGNETNGRRGVADTSDLVVFHVANAFRKPITVLNTYNLIKAGTVFLFYQYGFESFLSPIGVTVFNFWAFEFAHAFCGIIGIYKIVKAHPELRRIANEKLAKWLPEKLGNIAVFNTNVIELSPSHLTATGHSQSSGRY